MNSSRWLLLHSLTLSTAILAGAVALVGLHIVVTWTLSMRVAPNKRQTVANSAFAAVKCGLRRYFVICTSGILILVSLDANGLLAEIARAYSMAGVGILLALSGMAVDALIEYWRRAKT